MCRGARDRERERDGEMANIVSLREETPETSVQQLSELLDLGSLLFFTGPQLEERKQL